MWRQRRNCLAPRRCFSQQLVAYSRWLREPILNWNATPEEVEARLPGDELLEAADGTATRAITIDAPPSAVWPWLAQIGPAPRAGAYTYDWIENLLRLNMHSVERVLPEFQHPEVGESLGLGANQMRYARVEPEHVLSLPFPRRQLGLELHSPGPNGETRLISRNRFRLPKLRDKLGMLPMEPGSLIMERKMLRGIKQRSERLADQRHQANAGGGT